jgi:AP-1 complex subunit gamma-1
MLPMSNPDVNSGSTETQTLRVIAPPGVSCGPRAATNTKPCAAQSQLKLRLRIAFTMDGLAVQDQVDFAGFPQGITSGSTV